MIDIEKIDKSLEEAAENYIAPIENEDGLNYINFSGLDIKDAFIAGAEWQAEQLLQGAPMPEDTVLFNKGVAEGRRLMMDEWLKDRDGCFWDGVNEGKKAMREQMMKEARDLIEAVEKYVVQGCSRSTLLAKKDKLKKLIISKDEEAGEEIH